MSGSLCQQQRQKLLDAVYDPVVNFHKSTPFDGVNLPDGCNLVVNARVIADDVNATEAFKGGILESADRLPV
jgi:hypothetical protein